MIRPPSDFSCATGQPIFTLVMSYQLRTCSGDSNQQGDRSTCQDIGPIASATSVKIVCTDADRGTALDVSPPLVPVGDNIFLTNPQVGALPQRVSCVVANSSNNAVLQVVAFDTSGQVVLDIKHGFGSLVVEGCDQKLCSQRFIYGTTVTNTGSRISELQELDLKLGFEANAINLVNTVTPRVLAPGRSADAADVIRVVDLCSVTDLGAVATAVALPQGTNFVGPCQDSKRLVINNVPECSLNVDLTCEQVRNGVDCRRITRETRTRCGCATCARELRFQYTAASCGTNVPGSGITCTDTGVSENTARVVFKRGFADLFEADVRVGGNVVWSNNGNCLPDTFSVFILRSGSSIVTQSLDISTRCAVPNNGIVLLTKAGALRFSGYSCSSTDVHNCFEDVAQEACVENGGTTLLVLTNFNLDVNGNFTDILRISGNDRQLTPGERNCGTVTSPVERCRANVFQSIASARTSTQCDDVDVAFDQITFNIGSPPVPAPTRVPTAGISAAPVRRPIGPGPTPPFPTPGGNPECPTEIRPVFAPPLPTNCP